MDNKEVDLILAGMKEQKDHLIRIEEKQDEYLTRFTTHEKQDLEAFTQMKTTVGVATAIFSTMIVGFWEFIKFVKGAK